MWKQPTSGAGRGGPRATGSGPCSHEAQPSPARTKHSQRSKAEQAERSERRRRRPRCCDDEREETRRRPACLPERRARAASPSLPRLRAAGQGCCNPDSTARKKDVSSLRSRCVGDELVAHRGSLKAHDSVLCNVQLLRLGHNLETEGSSPCLQKLRHCRQHKPLHSPLAEQLCAHQQFTPSVCFSSVIDQEK